MDATSLVFYSCTSHEEVVVGVKEFQIALALMEGQTQLLSQEVPSQWGSVHVFDLCLTFGYVDTALAMAQRGVEGCRLEVHHLKRIWSRQPNYDIWEFNPRHPACRFCKYEWQTCDICCFGFPTEQGIWMKDWDSNRVQAARAARRTAEQPLVHAALEAFSSGASIPFAVSEEAMVHLLDLAILTGNKEAARRCADLSELRPLRRWGWHSFFCGCEHYGGRYHLMEEDWFYAASIEVYESALLAALAAGAELQGLREGPHGLSAGQCVLLSSAPRADFAELLPPRESPWEVEDENNLGNFFIEIDEDTSIASMSKEQLQKAQTEGLPLHSFQVQLTYGSPGDRTFCSLLDVSILLGQSDCAVLCAAVGSKLSRKGCKVLQQHLDAGPARRSAAIAAAHEMLTKSWKSENSAKGIAVYQVMKKHSRGRFHPAQLVNQVLAFAIQVPEIVEDLGLWEEAHAWCETVHCRVGFHTSVSQQPVETPEASMWAEEAQGSGGSEERPTGSSDPASFVDDKASDELIRAISASQSDVPPLSMDGVRLFRLTRMANADHVDPCGLVQMDEQKQVRSIIIHHHQSRRSEDKPKWRVASSARNCFHFLLLHRWFSFCSLPGLYAKRKAQHQHGAGKGRFPYWGPESVWIFEH